MELCYRNPCLLICFLTSWGLVISPAFAEDNVGPEEDKVDTVYYDYVDDDGRLRGGVVQLTIPPLDPSDPSAAGGVGSVTTVIDNGPPANRIDLVFVGDGYLESQLGAYADHVDSALDDLLSWEPFLSYSTFFNAHRVDVVSAESGVDHDPTFPLWRDTALDMGFWCSNIDRLLCVNVSKAYQQASSAPDIDHVFAVANSTKYGGAGYSGSDLATYAGGNSSAPEVAIHEVGHSLGNLADEYDYGNGVVYTGPERPEPNVSILQAAHMANLGTKWADWLGDPGIGFGGTVSTYEGAYYSQDGIYRPTFDSKMRSLGAPFNLPSVEAMIIEMYKIVSPIDDATPSGTVLTADDTAFVDPLDPAGHALDIQWSLDGEAIPGATQTTLDLWTLTLAPGTYQLAVSVRDNTELVRNESARSAWLTRTKAWTVTDDECILGTDNCDVNATCTNTPDSFTCACNTGYVGDGLVCQIDCQPNGVPDVDDLSVGGSQDCNANTVPDECDIADEGSQDCQPNDIPDECDLVLGGSEDCNENNMPDECEEGISPLITGQPESQEVAQGTDFAFFSVLAEASVPAYQWRKDGEVLVDGGDFLGTTQDTVLILDAQPADAGSYDCLITELVTSCSTLSDAATLTVLQSACPADLDGDGEVRVSDLIILLAAWGPVPTPDPPDFDGDGEVRVSDLIILLAAWGQCN